MTVPSSVELPRSEVDKRLGGAAERDRIKTFKTYSSVYQKVLVNLLTLSALVVMSLGIIKHWH